MSSPPRLDSTTPLPTWASTLAREVASATAAPTARPPASAAPKASADTCGVASACTSMPPPTPDTRVRSPSQARTSEPSSASATAALTPANTPPAAPHAPACAPPSELAAKVTLPKPAKVLSFCNHAWTLALRAAVATTAPAASAPAAMPVAVTSSVLASLARTARPWPWLPACRSPATVADTVCSRRAKPMAAPTPTRPAPPA